MDLGQYNLAESIEPDSWDAWNSDRDQAITSAEASSTAATNSMPNNNNPAWSDLNQNGAWYNTPDQGYVWSPYDASNPGWDPYGNGSWVDEPSYGYVWVSSNPWGYMPYQCGAWSYYSAFGWGWAPGACSPWWGGGEGWFFNYGHYPSWYRPPFRPRTLPREGGPGRPHPVPGHPVGHEPIIAVNRPTPVGRPALPPRDSHSAVMIGGTVVEPLARTPRRQSFARAGFASPNAAQRTLTARPGESSRPVYNLVRLKRAGAPALRRAVIFRTTSRAGTRATAHLALHLHTILRQVEIRTRPAPRRIRPEVAAIPRAAVVIPREAGTGRADRVKAE